MQQNEHLTQRLIIIAGVMLVGLYGIFPGFWRLDFRPDIKKGIDIQGGTSLVYEIKAPEGQSTDGLADRVIAALKPRVDPNGVRNLVWRALGDTQLEVQMPSSAGSKEAAELRTKFVDAQAALERTNVRLAEIRAALALADAGDRERRLQELAAGSPTRQRLFAELADAERRLKTEGGAEDPEAPARRAAIKLEIEKIEVALEKTNIQIQRLQTELELADEAVAKARKRGKPADEQKAMAERAAKIKALKEEFDFAQRAEAVDAYVAAFDKFAVVRGSASDAEDLKRLLRGSGILEFHILVTDAAEIRRMAERLKNEGPAYKPGDDSRWLEVEQPEQLEGRPLEQYGGKTWALVSMKPDECLLHGKQKWGLEQANRSFDPDNNRPVVAFELDVPGSILFGDLTRRNLQRPLAIVLDGRVISAPNLRSAIEKRGQIFGKFSDQDIMYLVNTLNAGSLPAKLGDDPIRERTIGPSLGADNLHKGFISCVIGVLAVAIFMVVYYYFGGLVSAIAVMINLGLNISILAMFGATFTLPGIAALVLTLGMSVDANVLIFERMREEQHRGLSLRLALHNAHARAFSAILDSNVTTVATSMVLYFFGSEEVRGFGLTLAVGVTCSMFSALVVTRAVFDLFIEKFGLTRLGSLPLSFPKWDKFLRPNVDWMGKAWIFYAMSLVIIVAGLTAFFSRGRQMWSIEFVAGTSVEVETRQPMNLAEVRKRVAGSTLEDPNVIAVGDEGTNFEITTATIDTAAVRSAVLAVLGDVLNVERESRFERSHPRGEGLIEAMQADIVQPISSRPLANVDFAPPSVRGAEGGVAIVLRNLDPPLSAAELQKRIDRTRVEARDAAFSIRVDGEQRDPSAPNRTAVVVAYDPAFDYQKDRVAWEQGLAAKAWTIVNQAIGRPAELRGVTNFNPQVADAMKVDATIAVTIAILVITVYIWVRFANLKFGLATVVALIHDVLIVLGVIGLTHYLSVGILRDWLLITPLRMDLTLIAAVLTVMGYSVNDTIIVFDRIRENRGKYGYISRKVINDSVNQTLSRTLLTSGTTLLTIAVMYFWGGPGIHGFTYALLAGILVGTYSSIAIAAPILLLGGKDVRVDALEQTLAAAAPAPQGARR